MCDTTIVQKMKTAKMRTWMAVVMRMIMYLHLKIVMLMKIEECKGNN